MIEDILQERKSSVITTTLCTTLAGNARLNELTKVVAMYSTLMEAKRGEVDATITSADPFTKKKIEQVAAAILRQHSKQRVRARQVMIRKGTLL